MRARLRWLWTYYRGWAVVALCLLAIGAYLLYGYTHRDDTAQLYVVFANTRTDVHSTLWQDFTRQTGLTATFDDASYFRYTPERVQGYEYFSTFVALSDTGTLDAIAMETEDLRALGQSGWLLDLSLLEDSDLLTRYASRLLYCERDGDRIPVGIDISDSALVGQYGVYTDSCALGLGCHCTHLDAVAQFLQFVLAEN